MDPAAYVLLHLKHFLKEGEFENKDLGLHQKFDEEGYQVLAFKDLYGWECSLQRSGMFDNVIFLNVPSKRMHLNTYQVKEIIKVLQDFVDSEVTTTK